MEKTSQNGKNQKRKPAASGFVPFAIFVFTALAIGLVVILIRSQA